ncbi:hypothetical protein BDV93DRAFT_525309 [Ceratobasidium sp. AG-I]|nr:hypothetical protein BDV93DRAFT_525309 [Ceratobasidium sp. AG-I]
MISAHYRRVLFCLSLFFASPAASQQPLKVDDANAYSPTNPNGIQFSADAWNTISQETTELHYNGTYTWSQKTGANMMFFFRGTAIALYAEKATYAVSAAIVIDGNTGIEIMWSSPGDSQYRQQIWNVMINYFGTGDRPDDVLGLDYLEVTPGVDGLITPASSGPGASVIPPNAVLVDDSSDMISYAGSSWEVDSFPGNLVFYLGGTVHSSGIPGATFTFKFNGTAVWYFSDQHENYTTASISIDGGAPELVDTSSPTGEWVSCTCASPVKTFLTRLLSSCKSLYGARPTCLMAPTLSLLHTWVQQENM